MLADVTYTVFQLLICYSSLILTMSGPRVDSGTPDIVRLLYNLRKLVFIQSEKKIKQIINEVQ